MDHYRPIRVSKIVEFVVFTAWEPIKKNGEIVPMKHEIGTLKIESLAKTIRISEKRTQPAIIVLGKII